jgi:cystathionine beta-lyase
LAAVTASLNPELTELSLERLRLRKSAKWRFFDPDVLPAFVAEMDFPLAPAVKIALAEAVELDDTGYGYPAALGLAEAFADFAKARLGWEVDPAGVTAAPDVVNAITCCA